MKRLKYLIYCFSILSILFYGCSKNEPPSSSNTSSSSNNNNSATTSCSAITAQATVTSNGVTYTINALGGAGNSIGIEVINSNGVFTSSYAMQLLEVSNGTACETSTTSVESLPGFGKFFEFQNMPSYSSQTSTVAKVKIMLDGTVFNIQDLHVNQ